MDEMLLLIILCTIIGIVTGCLIGFYIAKRNCDRYCSQYKMDSYKHSYIEKAYKILLNHLHKNDPNEDGDLEDVLGFLGQYLDD